MSTISNIQLIKINLFLIVGILPTLGSTQQHQVNNLIDDYIVVSTEGKMYYMSLMLSEF